MNRKLIQVRTHLNAMTVTWVMNNICTNHCDYCPPVLHRGNNHNYSWDRAREFMNRLFKRYLRVNLSISGGEPTLSPFLKTFQCQIAALILFPDRDFDETLYTPR